MERRRVMNMAEELKTLVELHDSAAECRRVAIEVVDREMSRKLVRLADELEQHTRGATFEHTRKLNASERIKAAFVHVLHRRAVGIFDLDPAATAPAFIGQIFPLCDYALVPELAGMIEDDVPSDALDMIVELDPVLHLCKKIGKELFALDERLLADLGPFQFPTIKGADAIVMSGTRRADASNRYPSGAGRFWTTD
jgi:hypothetical protein